MGTDDSASWCGETMFTGSYNLFSQADQSDFAIAAALRKSLGSRDECPLRVENVPACNIPISEGCPHKQQSVVPNVLRKAPSSHLHQ
ncbi:hypothetical protein BLNAU_7743 [Blattamonas nauphoetae]|uniref:Uncharacterized protein n=1 Tax=Blattamonas nauphoetae TaxID=2049346 RepID=A0ABQ9Y0V2_9EUKA|nr:hypothetical protein BLNAU_7743 [Blattamonas nauphoetae]